jgi:HEAT repeats
MSSARALRVALLTVVLAGLLAFASKSGALQAVADMIFSGHNLPVQGPPVVATAAKLSEHEINYIEGLPPQAQAEELMQRSINHIQGANRMIEEKLESWRGQLKPTDKWEHLYSIAICSNDLRIRSAAIEIDLAANGLDKVQETVDRLMRNAEEHPDHRFWDAYFLGLLANRGLDVEKIENLLHEWIHDPDRKTRYWAIEGMAVIGTDETIPDLLDVMKNDPLPDLRERGVCSLAQSGMMARAQRMKAVPGLIDIADTPSVDATTRGWAFQALREITDENFGTDTAQWRNWFDAHGAERIHQFQGSERNQIIN